MSGEAERMKEENTDDVQTCAKDVTVLSDLQYRDDKSVSVLLRTYNSLK